VLKGVTGTVQLNCQKKTERERKENNFFLKREKKIKKEK
jgi:hypothetical protein